MSAHPPALHNVLLDPMFTVCHGDGGSRVSLSELLASLLTGTEITAFPKLEAIQRSYWWRFLIRCAARTLKSLDLTDTAAAQMHREELAAKISSALVSVSSDDAWYLYQPDPARPGFLQHPFPHGLLLSSLKADTVSLLSVALGAKDHERKVDVPRSLDPEGAAFALVAYQQGVIYGGPRLYESQLTGSRSGATSGCPFMGAYLRQSLVATFRHDLSVLLADWDMIRGEKGLRGSTWALWSLPWNGESPLPARELDPAFIPLGRSVRLFEPHDGYFSKLGYRTSSGPRVTDHSGGGDLGDPFCPLAARDKGSGWKVRGTLSNGYDYTEVVRLLFGRDTRPSQSVKALARIAGQGTGADDVRVVFEGLALSQGKSHGFYARETALPARTIGFLDEPDTIREVHDRMLATAKQAKKALYGAARILMNNSPKPRKGDAGKAELPALRFEDKIDSRYVPFLLDAAVREKAGDPLWHQQWVEVVATSALDSFSESLPAFPMHTTVRLQRELGAERYLRFKLAELRETVDSQPEA